MARGPNAIGCPFCPPDVTPKTNIVSTQEGPHPHIARRRYKCLNDSSHRFWTEERVTADVGPGRTELWVERVPGHPRGAREWDREIYRGELDAVTLRLLTSAELDELTDAVLSAARMHARLDESIASSMDEQRGSVTYSGDEDGVVERLAVPSEVLANVTLRRLRDKNTRIPHALYAMLFLGRTDLPGRDGFRSAAELLRWLFASDRSTGTEDAISGGRYGDLRLLGPDDSGEVEGRPLQPVVHELVGSLDGVAERQQEVQQRRQAAQDVELVTVRHTPPVPKTVVKLARRDRRALEPGHPLETARFNLRGYEASIRDALWGRRGRKAPHEGAGRRDLPDASPWRFASHSDVLTRLVADWVLADLAGQQRITSSQLATMTLRTLRRVDDLGYLRYAVKTKAITRVSDLVVEATGLITHPSRRLIFAAEGAAALERYYPWLDTRAELARLGPEGEIL